jgi:glycerophosphoryl diester phosphodiesterase
MMAAKDAAPKLPRGWLTERFEDSDWDRLRDLEAVSLHTDYKTIEARDIGRLHDKGYRVLVYTVNDPEEAQALLDAGIDGLFTDNLAEFAQRFPDAIR